MSKYVPIAQIRRDGGTQSREAMNEETIVEYVEVVKQGTQFPAVTLYHDGTEYWLADGFHRVEAHSRAGIDKVWADVHQGTRRDAVLHSVGANANHGLRRTNEDKRRAAMVLLTDDEWKQWSDREIARKVGVSPQTISNYRKELPSDQNGQITERTVTRNGQTYTMKTENIGSGEKNPTLAERHNQDRVKFQAASADNYLLIYRYKEANTDCYLFIASDAARVQIRSEEKIKADTITVEGEKLPIAKVNAEHYRQQMYLDINLRYINFEESQLCETLTPLLHEISIQNLVHYKTPEKKPAPQVETKEPLKFEDATQHEGLKLYYLKPQAFIGVETNSMWRNAYHIMKGHYAQDAIMLCLINGHGFVAMNEDADALESALATIKHEGKRVGLYYLMPHVQQPFYSEVLRLTGKKIVYFGWIANDGILFWRDNWNGSKQLSFAATDEQTVPAVTDEPAADSDEQTQTVAAMDEPSLHFVATSEEQTRIDAFKAGQRVRLIRDIQSWRVGTEFTVHDTGNGLLGVREDENMPGYFVDPVVDGKRSHILLWCEPVLTDDTPEIIFGVGERVKVNNHGIHRTGTIRYIKYGMFGVYLDTSNTTHYYDASQLSPELSEEIKAELELPYPTEELIEFADSFESESDESITFKPGDKVRTRVGRLETIASIQPPYAYMQGSNNPHKLASLTLDESPIPGEIVTFFTMLEFRQDELLQAMKSNPQFRELWQQMNQTILEEVSGSYA